MTGSLGVSLGLLWSLEAFLEPPGALLAASWNLFGRSWGALGASWGGLGASWAPLGPSWRRSKRDQDNMLKKGQLQERKWCGSPNLKGPKKEPQIDPNRTQNESKIKTIFKSEKVALQEPLGAVLGRSWGIWEAILGSKFALPY